MNEIGEAFAGRNRASLDDSWEEVDGRHAMCADTFHQLVNSHPWECDNVTLLVRSHGVARR